MINTDDLQLNQRYTFTHELYHNVKSCKVIRKITSEYIYWHDNSQSIIEMIIDIRPSTPEEIEYAITINSDFIPLTT